LKVVQRENAEYAKSLLRKQKELDDARRESDTIVASISNKKEEDISHFRSKAFEAEHALNELEIQSKAEHQRMKHMINQFKEKLDMITTNCDSKLSDAKSTSKRLMERNR
jgi:hypothetical protein